MRDVEPPREVGEEDEARLQRRDEYGFELRVVRGDRGGELADTRGDLVRREVRVADARRVGAR